MAEREFEASSNGDQSEVARLDGAIEEAQLEVAQAQARADELIARRNLLTGPRRENTEDQLQAWRGDIPSPVALEDEVTFEQYLAGRPAEIAVDDNGVLRQNGQFASHESYELQNTDDTNRYYDKANAIEAQPAEYVAPNYKELTVPQLFAELDKARQLGDYKAEKLIRHKFLYDSLGVVQLAKEAAIARQHGDDKEVGVIEKAVKHHLTMKDDSESPEEARARFDGEMERYQTLVEKFSNRDAASSAQHAAEVHARTEVHGADGSITGRNLVERLGQLPKKASDAAPVDAPEGEATGDESAAEFVEPAEPAEEAPEVAPSVTETENSGETDEEEAGESTPSDALPSSEGKELVVYAPFEHVQVQFSPELKESLDAAMDRYAKETAKKRNSYIGHFLKDSKFWVKVPGLQKLADWANDRADEDVIAARADYEKRIGELNAVVQGHFEAMSPEESRDTPEYAQAVRMAKLQMLVANNRLLEESICRERQAITKKPNKFVNWWVKRSGFTGTLAKGAVIAGTGFAAGLAAGLLAVPTLGALVGGAAGLGVAHHVTKRRANAEVSEGKTLASQQRDEALRMQDELTARSEGLATVEDYTSLTDYRTAQETVRNRKRMKTAAGLGAAAGGIGGMVGAEIRSGIENALNGNGSESTNGGGNGGNGNREIGIDKGGDGSETTNGGGNGNGGGGNGGAERLVGKHFDIQSGSGYTQEIMDFAGANGHAIQPEQAYQLHKDLLSNFGNYINNASGNPISTYTQGGDLRISAPGQGQWAPDVAKYIQNWMATRGLW